MNSDVEPTVLFAIFPTALFTHVDNLQQVVRFYACSWFILKQLAHKLSVFSSVVNSLELLLVEQILTNLTNSKLKFVVVAKPTVCNEDFFQRDEEVWELYYYYCNIKT